MNTEGCEANANALFDAKHTALIKHSISISILSMNKDPENVKLWERGIFDSLDDELSKYGKIIRDACNDVAELHVKMSGDK